MTDDQMVACFPAVFPAMREFASHLQATLTREQQKGSELKRVQRDQEAADEARGYRRITVETFILDQQALARDHTTVSITGAYVRDGVLDNLYVDRAAAYRADNGYSQPNIPLLLQGASRDFRQLILECQSNPTNAHIGCPVTVLGHATVCILSNAFGTERQEPCLAVEDGRLANTR